MLRTLRWKLTLAFLAATLGLILLIGGGAYLILQRYFQTNVDLSLMYSMADQFHLFGSQLPDELIQAESEWLQRSGASGFPARPISASNEGEAEHDEEESLGHEILEGEYTADIAAIFVLPLDENGDLLFNPNPYAPPMAPNFPAAQFAMANGKDLRTIKLPSGTRVRLLSFRTQAGLEPAVLQLGRLLIDQDRALSELSMGVASVGGLILLLAGAGSWWLAGRTLVPAQHAWDQQQAFVANASHELRTPLTLMRASTEVALRSKLGKKERDLLSDVVQESDYMSRLVDDLLLLSRLDAGRLDLVSTPIRTKNLLAEVLRQVKNIPGGERIQIENGTGVVQGDRPRLRQVLLILLDNAIKHTPAHTEIRVLSRQSGKYMDLIVEDDGPGIPSEHIPHLFERFYQVTGKSGQATRSYGLGLSIAKKLIELQAGTIQVESQVGKGTRFIISLPAAK